MIGTITDSATILIEPRLVTETLQPLPDDRKCFRLINGVLVERTVKDVLPALKTNSDGLKQVLEELLKQYKGKEDEMNKWKVISKESRSGTAESANGHRRRSTISKWFRTSRDIELSCVVGIV